MNGGKYNFWSTDSETYQYILQELYNTTFIEPDNFDLAINYYKKH
jgi:hypothetical protein